MSTQPQGAFDPTEDFEDPLSNYDSKEYTDPLEKALASNTVADLEFKPYGSVPLGENVEMAVRALEEHDLGCLLVLRGKELAGVLSESDILHRVVGRRAFVGGQQDLHQVTVDEVMTRDPFIVHTSDSVATCLSVMALHGVRHVPVVNEDEEVVGVVNPRRLARFLDQAIEASGSD